MTGDIPALERVIYLFPGDYGEGFPVEIRLEERITLMRPEQRCSHLHSVEKAAEDSHWWNGVLPRAVIAWNQGKCDCTIVCLDCVVDAVGRTHA